MAYVAAQPDYGVSWWAAGGVGGRWRAHYRGIYLGSHRAYHDALAAVDAARQSAQAAA